MFQNVEARFGLTKKKKKKVTISRCVMALVASNKENELTCTRYNECGCSFNRCVLSLYTFLLR